MSIRINNAIRELNIGIQRAVEFLKKRKELGEVKDNLNFKLNDKQYQALVEEFKEDKVVKDQASTLFAPKPKAKSKPKKENDAAATVAGVRQKYTPLGHITLDRHGNPVAPKTAAQTTAQSEKNKLSADDSNNEKTADVTTQKPQTASEQKDQAQTQAKTQPQAQPEQAKPEVKPAPASAEKKVEAEKAVATAPKAEVKKPEPTTEKMTDAQTKPAEQAKHINEQTKTANEQTKPAVVKLQPQATKQQTPVNQPKQKNEQPKATVKAEAAKQQNLQPKQVQNQQPKQQPAAQKNKQQQQKNTQNTQPSAPKPQAKPTEKKSEPEVFTTEDEKKYLEEQRPKVLGKLDLSQINQSTRPKKKSRAELRRERAAAQQQQNGGEHRKRQRINGQRVDINAVANQQQPNGSGKKKKRNRGKGGQQKPLEVNEVDVAKQVRETLARLTNKQNQNKKGAKYRKEKREAVQEKLNQEAKQERKESKILKLTEFVTVSELATMMNVSVNQVISTLMSIGVMASINQRLDAETINMVAEEFGFKTEYVSADVSEAVHEEADDEADLVPRAPIVTVMGHVDHGKTSLLDHIRNTNVIAGEAGGITQHIGAYSVTLKNGRKVTFLDTPGHEAFTAMRARGAQVTDIAIIIIAADDSVMPTTKEAIAHAQAAGVPMVFAINKIDKPGANPDKIREDLANMNLLVEEWGGKYQCQEISAKKGIGVDELMDKVLLEADMLDLKANPNRKATGTVIESSLDKGRGYISTVLVSNGTLKVGDIVLAGTCYGRVKAMFNERNQRIEKAGPSDPAIVLGLNGAPTAGDQFHVLETEQEAKEIANKREQLQREQGLRTQTRLTLSDISHRIARGEFHELNIIVKGDTDGSVEALSDSFIKLSTEKVQVNVINKAVGQISENDVMLASASDAIIVGFQVRPSADARKLADREGVEINTYSIIYDAINDVKDAMVGMLDKVKKEIVTGEVEVKQVFKISKVGTVAGGLVTEGKVHNKDKARVVRDGIVIHTAPISALKRYKDDAKEVATGLECGISLVNYNDIQAGDVIETFTEIEVEQKL